MAHSLIKRSMAAVGATSLVLVGAVTPIQASSRSSAAMGGPVNVFGAWGSSERTDFQAILSWCDANYHTKATYTQKVSDYGAELKTKVQGGNPPDIGFLDTPGSLAPYIKGGALKPLDGFIDMKKLKTNYAPFWLSAATSGGKTYAVYMKADNKTLVWYNPKKFAAGHYTIPKTFDQAIALSNKMVKDGKHPWAFGLNQAGWTLTDMLENIYLQTAGPAMYDKWVAHTIKWTDPSIKNAFLQMKRIIGVDAFIAGSRAKVLSQQFSAGGDQVVTDPQAEFYQEASFMGAILRGDLPKAVEGVDYAAFPFPRLGKYVTGPEPVELGVNSAVMFKDTPGAEALMSCLADPRALTQWAKLGGFLSPNRGVSPSSYPDALTRTEATMITTAGNANLLRMDASDQMPAAFGGSYEFTALSKWFQNPNTNLDATLRDLETHAAQAYAALGR